VSSLWKEPPTVTKILNAAFPDMWGEGAGTVWTWYLARNSAPDEGYLTGKFETRMNGNEADKGNFRGGFCRARTSLIRATSRKPS
jgi:hypothetical protein